MSFIAAIESAAETLDDPYAWVGQVLTSFAQAEQALGRLSLAVDLSVANGNLSDLQALRSKIKLVNVAKLTALDNRIERWCANRPIRHLLAHATITPLHDLTGQLVIVTRHLPRDKTDVTPDRMWTLAERQEILRQARADARSICDRVDATLADAALLGKLRS